jgi:copper chaperone CopZ
MMKSMLLGVLGAGVIGAGAICAPCSPADAVGAVSAPADAMKTPVEADTSKVRLRIDGMTCGGCAVSARIVLERVEGVVGAEVDYEKKAAVVRYDAAKVTPERLIAVLREKLQYTATVIPEENSRGSRAAHGVKGPS